MFYMFDAAALAFLQQGVTALRRCGGDGAARAAFLHACPSPASVSGRKDAYTTMPVCRLTSPWFLPLGAFITFTATAPFERWAFGGVTLARHATSNGAAEQTVYRCAAALFSSSVAGKRLQRFACAIDRKRACFASASGCAC